LPKSELRHAIGKSAQGGNRTNSAIALTWQRIGAFLGRSPS